jgi:type II secretory pathway pseudopilin PulG
MSRPAGFTLLELMIAVSLGMLIVYASFAGLRAATQTMSVANKMSLENNLLQAGFMVALDELDTWRAYDDPESSNPADRVQRDSGTAGLLFKPLNSLSSAGQRRPLGAQTTDDYRRFHYRDRFLDDNQREWDPHYFWPPNDPRTWWRGNPVEWYNTIGLMGDYSLFAKYDTVINSPSSSNSTGPGDLEQPYTWLYHQMNMLHTNLGFYAFLDYLPPSMLINYVEKRPGFIPSATSSATAVYSMSSVFTDSFQPNSNTGAGIDFRPADQLASFTRGRFVSTRDLAYTALPLKSKNKIGQTIALNEVTQQQNFFRVIGKGAKQIDINRFNWCVGDNPLLNERPESWPEVTVETTRFIGNSRFVNLFTIRWTNSLSGESHGLSFTGIGTTLRGARNMRKYSATTTSAPGWANWYGSNPNNSPRFNLNDPTLDNPNNISRQ